MVRSAWLDFPDDFAPEPTVFNGGPDRQKQIWEACRAVNSGGYGSGCVQSVKSMGIGTNSKQVTSCSPFTATCIGMMFDTRPGVVQTDFEPMFDRGRSRLGRAFYQMHNGNYFAIDRSTAGDLKRTTARSQARLDQWAANKWPSPARSWDGSAMSLVWHNLGYQIDPRDMRRGDLVGIDWSPTNGGHAVFAWDVHLDAGAVDCFTFISSNGTAARGGAGISVYAGNWKTLYTLANGVYTCKLSPVFQDDGTYTKAGAWHLLPHKTKADIDIKSFNNTPTTLIDASSWKPAHGYSEYVGSLRVVRFWGVAPPENPHGTLLGTKGAQAHALTKWQPPEPVCMGSSRPPGRVDKLQPAQVPKAAPDPIKAAPPKPAPPQKQDMVLPHQHFVEEALAELYEHKWIDVDPGDPASVGDPKTKAAVQDFQTKFKIPPIDGIAGPKTRPALEQALADLHAGKPHPTKPTPPAKLDRFYWLSNRVAPGGVNGLAIDIANWDGWKSFEITLTDQHNTSARVPIPLTSFYGHGLCTVAIPEKFSAGSVLSARIRGDSNVTVRGSTDRQVGATGPESRACDDHDRFGKLA
jgi:peptidoglycan hydrolase-like protein with peptidoglycan-binding domain